MRTINKIIILTGFFFSTNTVSFAQLTVIEKNSLIFMYEEEKPAHDIYLKLSEKNNIPIFKNISKSETYHMSLISELIQKHELSVATADETGVFENKDLQKLYNDLIKKASKGITDALIVGATVEDTDIFDLEKMLSEITNPEIIKVYKQLICGSENHMRAFYRQLQIKNYEYQAQFISSEKLNTIVTDKHKKCF